jgi:hypothetical protein
MKDLLNTLHPDDVLFFTEVSQAMRRVAQRYDLPLRNIHPATMPESGMADYLGKCWSTGDIELVMRATVDGKFVDAPRTPDDVWRTAAHELAHLKHMNHGAAFHEFFMEMRTAMDNQQKDHREKILDKLVKMRATRDSEAAIGNTAAAEAFAGMINKMLIEHELNPSDIDYARATDKDPVIEMHVDYSKYDIKRKHRRIAWQETLARIVAKAHLCSFLIRGGSNSIWFVGTKSHVTVAEYVFGTLVPAADRMSYLETRKYSEELKKQTGSWAGVNGFRESWLDAFVRRIDERFTEARAAAVAEAAPDVPGSNSTALIRLSGALVKVQAYIDDRFKGKKANTYALSSGRGNNSVGRARGKAAADRITLGRRGLNSGSTRGLLK